MIIAFTAFNRRAEIQAFTCLLDSLEAGFDVVSSLVGQGNRLIEVVLIEERRIISLPIDAFDGQALSEPIRQLEQEWKRLLSKPVNYSQLRHNVVDQRIQLHRSNILKFEQAICLAEQHVRRVEKNKNRSPHHNLIAQQLENTLKRYQHNLAVEQASFQRCITVNRSDSI